MPITFAQLQKHLSQQNKWQGFGALMFTPELWTVPAVLGCLSAWSVGAATIRNDTRTRIINGTLPDAATIYSYASNFRDGPVLLVGFRLGTLRAIPWPDYAGTVGNDLLIWDGHHRTSALAIREAFGVVDDHPVIVFVGQ